MAESMPRHARSETQSAGTSRGRDGKHIQMHGRGPQESQLAYILHTYPYRETSLVVEVFARAQGRTALVARGARRPKSAVRGVLRAFQPLLLTWSGKGELRTLQRAEWLGGLEPLAGHSLICGFYLNELLLKLLPRDDPYEALFDKYQQTIDLLGKGGEQEATLRRFEKALLSEIGYGLILDRDAETGSPIAAQQRYLYVVERGPVLSRGGGEMGVELDGKTLLDMQLDNYAGVSTQQQSKALMRALINHCLSGRILHTRQLLRDLQDL
jgi:DNA repair protein RecO (recombination protein O)